MAERTIYFEIFNDTNHTLSLGEADEVHGGWALFKSPPLIISSNSSGNFQIESSGTFTGAEAKVSYIINLNEKNYDRIKNKNEDPHQVELFLHLDNPFAGSNVFNFRFEGPQKDLFHLKQPTNLSGEDAEWAVTLTKK
ncbi:hypothetical protein AAIB41_14575 [Brucella sp. BE17]|uniref:hypothetical protein n=1 Tax=Brucella sp. BE17 TaxID=3142977 RepID=UPI0031BA39E1